MLTTTLEAMLLAIAALAVTLVLIVITSYNNRSARHKRSHVTLVTETRLFDTKSPGRSKEASVPPERLLVTKDKPLSVNYHFTRRCNMACGFCFHTATTSSMQDIDNAIKGIKMLKEAGMQKINFAGGEPFLYPKFLGLAIDCCKAIGVESWR